MKNEKKEVKIEKMVLNIDGEKVSLSMEQAKKLKNVLDELFGREVIKEVIRNHHYYDWVYRPYYWGQVTTPDWRDNITYCSNNSLQLTV